jgi:hypothetical protein
VLQWLVGIVDADGRPWKPGFDKRLEKTVETMTQENLSR